MDLVDAGPDHPDTVLVRERRSRSDRRSHVSRMLMLSATRRSWISYRDEGSRAFMASIGHDVSGETVVPDLVFSMRPSDRSNGARDAHDRSLGTTVGLGVMAYDGWRRGDAKAGTIRFEYVDLIESVSGSWANWGQFRC